MIFELNGHRGPQNEELLADLREVATKLKRNSFKGREYSAAGKYNLRLFCNRFGSWSLALLKAGLVPTENNKLSAKELLENIHTLWLALGRQPRKADLLSPLSKSGIRAYVRVFGGWQNALVKMVELYNGIAQQHVAPAPDTIASPPEKEVLPKRHINWRLRYLVMKHDNFRCVACGASPAKNLGIELHVDHIIPQSKGGESVAENLQTLCSVCNIGKGDLLE